jgi:hypothetical protein
MPAPLTFVVIGLLGGIAAGLGPHLRLLFGVFITGLGVYLIHGASRRLGWI